MSENSLRGYEGDVEIARAKLNASLDVLRSPDTLSSFSGDLKNEARAIKDELIEQTKSAAKSKLDTLVEEVKAKAAANPAAALAIGAGLGWHFLRHPPIASALIGLGVFSLWRTTAAPPHVGVKPDYLELGKQRLKEQAHQAAGQVKDAALEGQERLSEKVSEFKTAANSKIQDWAGEVRNTVSDLTETLRAETPSIVPTDEDIGEQGLARKTTAKINDAVSATQQLLSEQDSRDKLLLGLAGVAVAAALGIACQKRFGES